MNAIIGTIENKPLSVDMVNLIQAQLSVDELFMNIIMKSVSAKIKAAVKKQAEAAAKKAVAKALRSMAETLLVSIEEDKKAARKAKEKKEKLTREERSARHSETMRKAWASYSDEKRASIIKNMSDGKRRAWESYTDEQREARRRSTSEANRKTWANYTESQRAKRVSSMRQGRVNSGFVKVRFDELTEEEQAQYSTIAGSSLIRETFILRECRCLNEANQLLGQYLRGYSRENKFKNVHDGNHAMYDIRAIEWLCNNYKNNTFDEATYGSLSYYFE